MSVRIQDVQEQLKQLSSLNQARALFAEMNYEYSERPVPWQHRPDARVAEPPRVIAERGDFRIIYTRMADDRLLATRERPIIDSVMRTYPYSLFLFSDNDHSDWHFVNVKDETETSRTKPKAGRAKCTAASPLGRRSASATDCGPPASS